MDARHTKQKFCLLLFSFNLLENNQQKHVRFNEFHEKSRKSIKKPKNELHLTPNVFQGLVLTKEIEKQLGPFAQEVDGWLKTLNYTPSEMGNLVQEALCVKEAQELVTEKKVYYKLQ